ncbi:MAG: hypothetical protein AABZ74_10200 [Cyanobacteriota bacterium]
MLKIAFACVSALLVFACSNVETTNFSSIKKESNPQNFVNKSIDSTDIALATKGDWFYNNPKLENDPCVISGTIPCVDPLYGKPKIGNEAKIDDYISQNQDNVSTLDYTKFISIPTGFVLENKINDINSSLNTNIIYSNGWGNSSSFIEKNSIDPANTAYQKDFYRYTATNTPIAKKIFNGTAFNTYTTTSGANFKARTKIGSTTNELVYTDGQDSWVTSTSWDSNSGIPKNISNTYVDNINTDFSVSYKNNTSGYIQNWGNVMSEGWKTKNMQDCTSGTCQTYPYTYNFNKDRNLSINLKFKGTNVYIYGFKTPDGFPNLKMTLDKGKPSEKVFNVNTYNSVNKRDLLLKIQDLDPDFHNVTIEADYSNNFFNPHYTIGFSEAFVYPSITFSGDSADMNFAIKTLTSPSQGKIETFVNHVASSFYDNYNNLESSTFLSPVSFDNTNTANTVTLQVSPDKHLNSTGNKFSVSELNSFSSVESKDPVPFDSGKIILWLPKSNNLGKMDLYVNNIRVKTIDLYKNITGPVFEAEVIDGLELINGLTFPNNYKFKLVAAYDKNLATNRFLVGFDGYNIGEQSVTIPIYTFKGGEFFYKGLKGPKNGYINLQLTNSSTNTSETRKINLYSANPSPPKLPTEFGVGAERPAFTIVQSGTYSLKITPDYTKDPLSSGYNVNLAQFLFVSAADLTFPLSNSIDTVCDP